MARRQKPWPPLPESIMGPAGRVSVVLAGDTFPHAPTPMGTYETMPRVIRIAPGMPPEVTWHTFFHEVVEMALDDSGLQNIFQQKKYAKLKEAVCDAVALGMLAQFRGEHGL